MAKEFMEMPEEELERRMEEIRRKEKPSALAPNEGRLVEEITDNPVPSIQTLSFREIVSHYREQCVEIKGGGGEDRRDKVTLSSTYGITKKMGATSKIEINYKQERDKSGDIVNPWNKSRIDEAFEYLNSNLPKYEDEATGKKYPPDIPIEHLVVEIEDDKIAELAGTESSFFDIEFGSDVVEERIYDDIKKLNRNLGVYEQGFKVRNLNARMLLEREQKYGEPEKRWEPIIKWKGPPYLNIKSPIKIAGRIRDYHLPPRYALLKTYRIVRGNQLELDGVR